MFSFPIVLANASVLFIIIKWLNDLRRKRNVQYPPGPPGYPLIGNVFDIMTPEMWKRGQELGDTYGGLIYLQSLGQKLIIINSYDIAVELLEARSLNHSDRPQSVMLNELQRWDWMFVNFCYGEPWRKVRAVTQRFLEPSNIVHYEDVLNKESSKWLHALLRRPEDYDGHIRSTVASIIMTITYGHEVVSSDDQYVSLAKEGTEQLALAMRPGAFLVDVIPWLKHVPKWCPGAGFQAIAECGAKLSHNMRFLPYFDTKERILAGTALRSFTSEQIEAAIAKNGKLQETDEEMISAAAGVLYIAGADSIVSCLMTFMLTMTLFPEAQKRAQKEIDDVVGDDRLPCLSDRAELRYCESLYKEVMRFNAVFPLGAAHATKHDDTFEGYFIPAKTMVIANQWAMLQDPIEYPQPNIFSPERFMRKLGKREPRDPGKVAFGFGRRVCPGKHLVENIVFLIIVRTLASFNISKTKDIEGEDIEPIVNRTLDGIVSRTHRFECLIKSRSEKAEELIALD